MDKFRGALRDALIESHDPSSAKSSAPWPKDGLGRRLLDAHQSGQWDEKQMHDNLTVLFVAGQENPQLCLISTLYLLAKHPVGALCWSECKPKLTSCLGNSSQTL